MCIDCLPTFMDCKMVKLLARNFQLYIKAQKESQGENSVESIVIKKRTLDLKFPWQIIFLVSFFLVFFFLSIYLKYFLSMKKITACDLFSALIC